MTPERLQRINNMLNHRQPDLTVCMEGVHKAHNLAAVVRTCDAIGVSAVHAVWKNEQMRASGGIAAGSQNWVDVHNYTSTVDAIAELKRQDMQVLVTNLSDTAVDFREIDYTKPTAIILGQEKFGASDVAKELADQDIVIPMVGMVQSLNVSVANAVVLYEAQRQRAFRVRDATRRGCRPPHRTRFSPRNYDVVHGTQGSGRRHGAYDVGHVARDRRGGRPGCRGPVPRQSPV